MAEAVTFRKISTGQRSEPLEAGSALLFSLPGATDDLQRVTQLAYRQVVEAGLSDSVGHLSFPLHSPGRRPYSKWLAAQIDNEVCVMCTYNTCYCLPCGTHR